MGCEVGVLNLAPVLKSVLWVSFGVLAIDVLLATFILVRRLRRWLYFKRTDGAVKQFGAPIHSFVAGDLPADDLIAILQTMHNIAERDAVRGLLLDNRQGSERVTEILFRLGYVEAWAREAFGHRRTGKLIRHIVNKEELPPPPSRRFARIRRLRLFCIKRAIAVSQLGQLDAAFSGVFFREAMADPSSYVIRANVAAIRNNLEAHEIPLLLELLRQAVKESTELPVTSVKTTLVRCAISDLNQFVPFLNDEDPRYRFVLVDSIREICDGAKFALNAKDFPEDLYQWFVDKAARDESVDVRARSARVIRHFHDAAATLTLRSMIEDGNEFVRLHTVRACADSYYSELIPDITRRITDPRWRVREASVKTLAKFGKAGRAQLAQYFLNTTDRFASEQLIEEMQRNGIIAEMLPALSAEDGESKLAMNVCAKMVRMGKTSLLADLLGCEMLLSRWAPAITSAEPIIAAEKARAQLLDLLLEAPTNEVMITLRALAERKDDHLSAKAQATLESIHAGVAGEEPQCMIFS
jgi:hypothetical protein